MGKQRRGSHHAPTSTAATRTAEPDKLDSNSLPNWVPTTLLICFFAARQCSVFWVNVPVISCAEDQPLYTRTNELFDEDTHDKLLDAALNSPRADINHLSSVFDGSRGFLLRFSREGLRNIEQDESLADLRFVLPFFESVQDPLANNFVLNVLIITPGDSDGDKPAVDLHVDNTVALDSARKWLAHSVSVYYLQIPPPERVSGGALELFTTEDTVARAKPDALIYPLERELVVFRGDAYHRVTKARRRQSESASTRADLRVSLVLEQYRIPPDQHRHATAFEVNRQHDHRIYFFARVGFEWFNSFSYTLMILLCAVYALQTLLPNSFGKMLAERGIK